MSSDCIHLTNISKSTMIHPIKKQQWGNGSDTAHRHISICIQGKHRFEGLHHQVASFSSHIIHIPRYGSAHRVPSLHVERVGGHPNAIRAHLTGVAEKHGAAATRGLAEGEVMTSYTTG